MSAEVQESGGKNGKSKQKKFAVRVDFTPMVDMNMLLITFFMLCTTLSKPQTMEISMPSNDKNITEEQKSMVKASQAITLLLGTRDYNGAGMDVIARAIAGEAEYPAFLWKILLTALTLGAGYKGGEIVPSFFVGATFGCVAAPLLGIPAGFGAALGLAGVFCGASNCVVASLVLAIELFGAQGLWYFAIVCGITYALSG